MKSIIKQELRIGLKTFLFWTLGLSLLTIGGMFKYLGFNANTGVDISVLFNQFPKIIIAMFGMANLDIQSLGGFYAVLESYVLISTAIFSIYLGTNAVSREMVDKTYEFIFTKPRTRSCILTGKLLGGMIYLCTFCILNGIFSIIALQIYGILNTIQTTILLYSLASFLVGIVFFSLSAMLSTLFKRSEIGTTVSNAVFIFSYTLSVMFDSLDKNTFIKPFTPLRYFVPKDLIAGQFDVLFLGFSLVLCVIFLTIAYIAFQKRDLNAV